MYLDRKWGPTMVKFVVWRRTMGSVIALTAVLLAGCAMHTPASSGEPGQNEVLISNFAFNPSSLSLKVGTTITWKNQDPMSHTVTTVSAPTAFDSGTLPAGASYGFTFTLTGTYQYHCSIHPGMTGTITVTN
jgi:plastocyanin